MKRTVPLVMTGFLLGMFLGPTLALQAQAASPAPEVSDNLTAPKLETLLKKTLEGVDGREVIVSRVSIPAQTRLPAHWHPGEEFAYVLEGSVVLWQEGKEEILGKKGDALVVPLEQVHTAVTGDERTVILVFRVHAQGKPERILVEP